MRASTSAGWSFAFLRRILVAWRCPQRMRTRLLVMPYACTMVGGRPLLTPAPEQSSSRHRTTRAAHPHRVLAGQSGAVPELDRPPLHLDCEGARVPWVSVVASVAEETTRRAWVEDGRLVLRMPPSWSFEPGDPCARPPGFDDRFGFGRMRRYCADRRAMAPPPSWRCRPALRPCSASTAYSSSRPAQAPARRCLRLRRLLQHRPPAAQGGTRRTAATAGTR